MNVAPSAETTLKLVDSKVFDSGVAVYRYRRDTA
jgi:hypothetical protein